MKKKTKRSSIIITVLVCLIAISAGAIAYAATYTDPTTYDNPTYTNPNGSTNPDDATNHVAATTNREGDMVSIDQTVITGDQKTYLGTIRVIGDYMYVYGYYYDSANAPNTKSLTGWKMQTSDMGWGAAAISKTKATYAAPAGVIEEQPVTWMTRAYQNCTALTTDIKEQHSLPLIPATVKHTEYMFAGCTKLQQASLTTLGVINADTFNGCSNLKELFIGQNIDKIDANAFRGIANGCVLSVEGVKAPAGYANGWTNGLASQKYDADILIWSVE